MFAFQHESIKPDIMTLAKGLGNGMPIGACLAHGEAASLFAPGNHGSTFGGNPLACAAGLAVINELQKHALTERADQLGKRITSTFGQEIGEEPAIREIRNLGLLIAVELECDCSDLVKMALDDGLLINVCSGNTIRLLPPLTMSDDEADLLVDKLSGLIFEFIHNQKNAA